MPDLFNFSEFEVQEVPAENLKILVPQWYRKSTGTFLSDDERKEYNKGNKFLNLDAKIKQKRRQSRAQQ